MRYSAKQKLNALKAGHELPVDPFDMAHRGVGDVPPTDERAVLILAREYQRTEDADYVCVSWANQVRAAKYFNAHGLARTLDEIHRIGPGALK